MKKLKNLLGVLGIVLLLVFLVTKNVVIGLIGIPVWTATLVLISFEPYFVRH